MYIEGLFICFGFGDVVQIIRDSVPLRYYLFLKRKMQVERKGLSSTETLYKLARGVGVWDSILSPVPAYIYWHYIARYLISLAKSEIGFVEINSGSKKARTAIFVQFCPCFAVLI